MDKETLRRISDETIMDINKQKKLGESEPLSKAVLNNSMAPEPKRSQILRCSVLNQSGKPLAPIQEVTISDKKLLMTIAASNTLQNDYKTGERGEPLKYKVATKQTPTVPVDDRPIDQIQQYSDDDMVSFTASNNL